MSIADIFQIVYSDETKKIRDIGFLELDNTENLRPDWFEYWPIRNFLLKNNLNENKFYGFLSPKFHSKTGITSDEVVSFCYKNNHADVISFPLAWDINAVFKSVFEQGELCHKGIKGVMQDLANELDINIQIDDVVMTCETSIFCNYFVAKPVFWNIWSVICEKIFDIAESGKGDLAHRLNDYTNYGDSPSPMKTFVIERVASLIIAMNPQFKVISYDPFSLPKWGWFPRASNTELIMLNALKHAYGQTHNEHYLVLLHAIRSNVLNARLQPAVTE